MTSAAEQAAALLLAARRSHQRTGPLPEPCRPSDQAQARAIQERQIIALGGSRAWKIGAKSQTEQPLFAPIPTIVTAPSPARFAFADFGVCILEVEIGFEFAASLPKRDAPYDDTEILAALKGMMTCVEIVDSRFAAYPAIDRWSALADLQNNGAFVPGSLTHPNDFDRAQPLARLEIDRKVIVEKRAGNPAGDPLWLLRWLADQEGIDAGAMVTTGSCTGMHPLTRPAEITGSIEGLGSVALTLT